MRRVWLLSTLLLLAGGLRTSAQAEVRLPAVFSSHMVLQRDQPLPVWGWADPGEKVTVDLNVVDFRSSATVGNTNVEVVARNTVQTTVADDQGRWRVTLPAQPACSSPSRLEVKASNTLTIEDILIGEVWVCSGQSNMVWLVRNANDADQEIAAAQHPQLRLFHVPQTTAETPQDDVPAAWKVCSPETIPNFSAVAYFFGRQLQQTLGCPVGLINTAWGGTRAEAWTSPEKLAGDPQFAPLLAPWSEAVAAFDPAAAEAQHEAALTEWKAAVEAAKAAKKKTLPAEPKPPVDPRTSQHRPSSLYNGMIAPLVPFAMRGAIWYQGESNASRAVQYRELMPALIQSWRDVWGQGDFPFYQVQLANFRPVVDKPVERDWAELREAQESAGKKLPNVGCVCITDLGAATDIHPRDKQNVGKRLARMALHDVYGVKLVRQGPRFASAEVKGARMLVRFETFGDQLVSWYREPLRGFAIAGADRQWRWADARIVNSNTLEVWSDDISDPVAVRYNWADNPQGNLYNTTPLPALPFRTDDWPEKTAGQVTPGIN